MKRWRVLNLVWFALNCGAIIMLRLAWNRQAVTTVDFFKLVTIPTTFIALCVVCDHLLSRDIYVRRRGFSVVPHAK